MSEDQTAMSHGSAPRIDEIRVAAARRYLAKLARDEGLCAFCYVHEAGEDGRCDSCAGRAVPVGPTLCREHGCKRLPIQKSTRCRECLDKHRDAKRVRAKLAKWKQQQAAVDGAR